MSFSSGNKSLLVLMTIMIVVVVPLFLLFGANFQQILFFVFIGIINMVKKQYLVHANYQWQVHRRNKYLLLEFRVRSKKSKVLEKPIIRSK